MRNNNRSSIPLAIAMALLGTQSAMAAIDDEVRVAQPKAVEEKLEPPRPAMHTANQMAEISRRYLVAVSSHESSYGMQSQVSNICVTPNGSCYLPSNAYSGSPCWCNTPYGPVAGRVR